MVRFELGLIFSTTGPYAALGKSALAGALMAVDELDRSGQAQITAVMRDPAGQPDRYERATEELLAGGGLRHVVGAITSWSRKDMIPVVESHGGLLWYPCPYEGFENNDHVVYLGAAPNHHMVPLIDRMAGEGARRAYLIGSNYVWGWETLRLARERFLAHGGTIVGERYIPLGSKDARVALADIDAERPDFLVNSLIGPSNVAFMHALAELDWRKDPHAGTACPVVSCNQTEADLDELGSAADGMLSAGSFFECLAGADFRRRAGSHAPNGRASSFLATSYAAVRILARAVAEAGTDEPRAVFRAAARTSHETVLGPVTIDPVTRHAALTPHLARAAGGVFDIVESAGRAVAADPYLTSLPPIVGAGGFQPNPKPELRIVR